MQTQGFGGSSRQIGNGLKRDRFAEKCKEFVTFCAMEQALEKNDGFLVEIPKIRNICAQCFRAKIVERSLANRDASGIMKK